MATITGTNGGDDPVGPSGAADSLIGRGGAATIAGGMRAGTVPAIGADDTIRGGAGEVSS